MAQGLGEDDASAGFRADILDRVAIGRPGGRKAVVDVYLALAVAGRDQALLFLRVVRRLEIALVRSRDADEAGPFRDIHQRDAAVQKPSEDLPARSRVVVAPLLPRGRGAARHVRSELAVEPALVLDLGLYPIVIFQ